MSPGAQPQPPDPGLSVPGLPRCLPGSAPAPTRPHGSSPVTTPPRDPSMRGGRGGGSGGGTGTVSLTSGRFAVIGNSAGDVWGLTTQRTALPARESLLVSRPSGSGRPSPVKSLPRRVSRSRCPRFPKRQERFCCSLRRGCSVRVPVLHGSGPCGAWAGTAVSVGRAGQQQLRRRRQESAGKGLCVRTRVTWVTWAFGVGELPAVWAPCGRRSQ